MKQLKTLVLSLPFALAAAGCSQDDVLPDGGKGTNLPEGMQEVEITFDMGAATAMQTRSISRPVVSSDNWQRVNNVRIYLFKHNGSSTTDCTDTDGCGCGGDAENCNKNYELTRIYNKDGSQSDYLYVPAFEKPEDWGTKPSVVGDCDGTHQEDIPVWGDDDNENETYEQHTFTTKIVLSTSGRYKFLAVGRDDIDGQEEHGMCYQETWIKNSTPNESLYDMSMSLMGNWGEGRLPDIGANELFSGLSSSFSSKDISSQNLSITMKRVVPGFLLYVKNIPQNRIARASIPLEEGDPRIAIHKGKSYEINRVAIAARCISGEVPLVKLLGQEIDKMDGILEGIPTRANTNFASSFTAILYDSQWEYKEGIWAWKAGETVNPHWEKNSYLSGKCAVPLNLKTTPGNKPVIVGVKETDKKTGAIIAEPVELDHSLYLVFYTDKHEFAQIAGVKLPVDWIPIKIVSENGAPVSGEESKVFNFYPNRFYSIGERNYEDGKNKPIDLSSNLVITVNPDWDWKGDLEWAN